MSKTRGRKRSHNTQARTSPQMHQDTISASAKTGTRGKKIANPRTKAAGNFIMPSMVALGCWGLAFSFIFLTSEANHYLYGGMAVIMAIMWSAMVAMRINRMRRAQQSINQ